MVKNFGTNGRKYVYRNHILRIGLPKRIGKQQRRREKITRRLTLYIGDLRFIPEADRGVARSNKWGGQYGWV